MGGGICSREKFVDTNGKPETFFRMKGVTSSGHSLNWMCGGCFPAFADSLNYLIDHENVGMIVTLTIEPIKSGRNINHVPYDHDETEWVNGDDNLEEILKRFQVLHVPIADAGFPTQDNARILVEKVQKYHEDNPDKSVYFHCWAGRGRTSTVICHVIMKMYDVDYELASDYVIYSNPKCKFTEYQYRFLKGKNTETDLTLFLPIIKTPSIHKCYKIIENMV